MGKVVQFRRQRERRPKAQRQRQRNHRRGRKLNAPWLPLVALISVAAALYVASEFRTNSVDGSGNEIVGRAFVIDADTVEINGTRIRFYGIDAPENGQSCRVQGAWSRCGQLASMALANKIGTRPVTCEPKDRDRYNRVVAVCRVGGEDLNAWMVAKGWAMAYSRYSSDYIQHEREASASKVGIWQGDFVPPWEWRRGKRL